MSDLEHLTGKEESGKFLGNKFNRANDAVTNQMRALAASIYVGEDEAVDAAEVAGNVDALATLLHVRDSMFAKIRNFSVRQVANVYMAKLERYVSNERYTENTGKIIDYYMHDWLVTRGLGRFGPSSEYLEKINIQDKAMFLVENYEPEKIVRYLEDDYLFEDPMQMGDLGIEKMIEDATKRLIFLISFDAVDSGDLLDSKPDFISAPSPSEQETIRAFFKDFVDDVVRNFIDKVSNQLGVNIDFPDRPLVFREESSGIEGEILKNYEKAEVLVKLFLKEGGDDVVRALAAFSTGYGEEVEDVYSRGKLTIQRLIDEHNINGLKDLFADAPEGFTEDVILDNLLIALSHVTYYQDIIAEIQFGGKEEYEEVLRSIKRNNNSYLITGSVDVEGAWHGAKKLLEKTLADNIESEHLTGEDHNIIKRNKVFDALKKTNIILFKTGSVYYEIELKGCEYQKLWTWSEDNAEDIVQLDILSTDTIANLIVQFSEGLNYEEAMRAVKQKQLKGGDDLIETEWLD